MSSPLVEAYDLIAHAEVLESRIVAAARELSKKVELADEAAWLTSAYRLVARARKGTSDLLTRSLRLPELESLRGDHARTMQGDVVDAIDALQVAIATKIGERSPLIEANYRNLKTLPMRRAQRSEFDKFCVEIEKRLASSYVTRMLADPDHAVLEPALAQFRGTLDTWRNVFTSAEIDEDEAAKLRDELEAAARKIDVAARQARHLAEAVSVTAKEVIDASAVLEKPKRRALRREAETTGSLFAK
jgi:hypothetical protein